ncbi:hypothetical protein CPB85DRAFT_1432389 [Mucidula mucida]|nr:hypothetical protein CPB85DRAFT_1432389 [Mucidula mucida]
MTATPILLEPHICFDGTEGAAVLQQVPVTDSTKNPVTFTPLPDLGEGLYTSRPLHPTNRIMEGMSFEAKWAQDPARAVICRANSGATNTQFLLKVVPHLENENRVSLQALAAKEMWREAIFYAKHLRISRELLCHAIMVFGLRRRGGVERLCVQLWSILMASLGTVFRERVGIRWIRREAVQRVHALGIEHAQLCSGKEHHILYDPDTHRVNLVDFSLAHTHHHCRSLDIKLQPFTKPTARRDICGELGLVADILGFWRRRKTDTTIKDAPKDEDQGTATQPAAIAKSVEIHDGPTVIS